MTESDEKLSRLFAAETSQPDPAFVEGVDVRLRRAYQTSLAIRGAAALAFVLVVVAGELAWREARPALAQVVGPLPALKMDFMGAPAPALAVVAVVGLWFVFRRYVRLA